MNTTATGSAILEWLKQQASSRDADGPCEIDVAFVIEDAIQSLVDEAKSLGFRVEGAGAFEFDGFVQLSEDDGCND